MTSVHYKINSMGGYRREVKTWSTNEGNMVSISNGVVSQEMALRPLAENEGRRRKKRATQLTSSEIQQILTKHNDLRKNEGASDMMYMVSDCVNIIFIFSY